MARYALGDGKGMKSDVAKLKELGADEDEYRGVFTLVHFIQ